MEKHKITANVYVVHMIQTLAGAHRTFVGVYPTIELAGQAKVRQEEMWHDAIVTISGTTLHDANKLDLRIDQQTGRK